jgi:hypothetical protein
MEVLNDLIASYAVAEGQANVTNVMLGVSFMVVNATGN